MSKRRRYTAELSTLTNDKVEKRVILAYDVVSVRRHYTDLGYIVHQVYQGDYRKPAARPPTGARPNPKAIRKAIEFLGLNFPVEVHTSMKQGGALGYHKALPTFDGRFEHKIMVKAWLSAGEMGETLWHELAHAMQFERDAYNPSVDQKEIIKNWNKSYRDGTSYQQKPYEVEARSYQEFNLEQPLAR